MSAISHGFRFASCLTVVLAWGDLATSQGVQQASYRTFAQPRQRVATPALKYFGGENLIVTPAQRPPAAPPAPRPVQITGGKPFQSMSAPSTLSPYLGLDIVELDTGLPNYHAFTRPAIQQREAKAEQQAQLRRLQQQLRVNNATGAVSRNSNGGFPTTGHSSQFMNTSGYFPPAQ